MSREIKFRAWDKGIAKMLQVDKLRFDWGGVAALLGGSITKRGDEVWNTHGSFFLMQYTGLRDKNGQDIYEGDIVRTQWNEEDSKQDFVKEFKTIDYFGQYSCFWDHGNYIGNRMGNILEDSEVIGNIYENPALVKGDHAA